MKTNKTFAILAAISLVVGLVLACNKDINSNMDNTVQNRKELSKYQIALNELSESLNRYLCLSLNAYQNNYYEFHQACLNEDSAAFYSITNIPVSLQDSIVFLSDYLMELFYQEYPDSVIVDTCSSCMGTTSFLELFARIEDINNIINEIYLYEPSFDLNQPAMATPQEGCKHRCAPFRTSSSYSSAYVNCYIMCYMDLNYNVLFELCQYLIALNSEQPNPDNPGDLL